MNECTIYSRFIKNLIYIEKEQKYLGRTMTTKCEKVSPNLLETLTLVSRFCFFFQIPNVKEV